MIHKTNCPIWVLVVVILVFQTQSILSFFHEQPKKPYSSRIQSFSKIHNYKSSPTERRSSSSSLRSISNLSFNTYKRQRRFRRQLLLPFVGTCSTTLRAAGLVPKETTTKGAATATSTRTRAFVVQSLVVIPVNRTTKIGFWGHFGLFLISTMLVKTIYRAFILKATGDDTAKPAGIMNRCPWPFIFFHDIKQGFKDSPTWVVMMYMVLWRVLVAAKATGGAMIRAGRPG
jgi:hypothetical protein